MHTLNFQSTRPISLSFSLSPTLERTSDTTHFLNETRPSCTLFLSDWLVFGLLEFPAHGRCCCCWAEPPRLVCRSIVDNPLSLALSAHAHSHTLLLSPSSLSLSLSHFTIIFNKKPSHLEAWWWKNTSQEFKKKRRKERGRRLREKERKNRSLVLEKKRIAVDSRARAFFASGSPEFFSADGADSAKRQRRQKVVSLTNRSTHSKYISKSIYRSRNDATYRLALNGEQRFICWRFHSTYLKRFSYKNGLCSPFKDNMM